MLHDCWLTAGRDRVNLTSLVMISESYVNKYKALSAVSVVAVMLMTIASSYFTLTEFVDTKRQSSDWVEILTRQPALSTSEKENLDRINSELKSVNALIESMRVSADKSYPSMDLSVLDGKLDDLARRLKVLENAISSDPEKALVVPMLRKDHELLAKQFKDSVVAAKLDYDRLWGILMLLLTSIGAAVIALSGWALKSIFTKPKDGADLH